ncbi:hypothetical protein GCM10027262_75550 [Nocardia tengchongensis]
MRSAAAACGNRGGGGDGGEVVSGGVVNEVGVGQDVIEDHAEQGLAVGGGVGGRATRLSCYCWWKEGFPLQLERPCI